MKCTVLLTVYNGGEPLRQCVDSILTQDEPDFEFLIIDDCSTDDSPAYIRSVAQRDSRVRPIFHRDNAGLPTRLNEGLREARGDLVARMDHDDIALPHRLSTQIGFLQEHPEVALAGSFVYHMGRTPEYDRLIRLPVEHGEIAEVLPRYNCFYHPAVMFRRDVMRQLGGYRPEFENAEDYDLWLRTLRGHRLANIPVPLLRYRFSTGGMTIGKKWQQVLHAQMAIVSYHHPEWSIPEVEKQAAAELDLMGKDNFLLEVARGTMTELLTLGLTQDARRVWWTFFRQFQPRAKWQAIASGWRVYRQWKTSRPASGT